MAVELRPVDDARQLQTYIDQYWRRGHVLAHDPAMFKFTYSTPWVDRAHFPAGISALGLYDGRRMVGFLGAIAAPYPRPSSYWLALWHVLPELKGGGHGGKLLQRMQEIAEQSDGWIGTFGAGPEALPVYLKRGYCVRAGRRWLYQTDGDHSPASSSILHAAERLPDSHWLEHRYRKHPAYSYDVRSTGVFRTEQNEWGRVTHAVWLSSDAEGDTQEVFIAESAWAARNQQRYMLDAWSFDAPGPGWKLAPEDLPSVFHPVQARGNITYAVGRPFLPTRIHKGDCDQDRPNNLPANATPEPELVAARH